MDRILGVLFDVVWVWYVPALIEGVVLAMILLPFESLLARSRRVWPEIRTILLYLIFLKLVVPPQLSLPTGLVARSVTWIISRLEFMPLQLAGSGPPGGGGPWGQDVLWAYLHIEPIAAVTWVWIPLLGWLAGFVLFLGVAWNRSREFRAIVDDSSTPPPGLQEALNWAVQRLGLNCRLQLRVSHDISAPVVFGLRNPTVLFPAGLIDHLSEADCRHVFLHEASHVKRRHGWFHGTIFVLESVFWPNFLLQAAGRRLNHLHDLGCDADAIACGPLGAETAYRGMLLKVTEWALGLSEVGRQPGLSLFRRPALMIERLHFAERRFHTPQRTRLLTAGLSAALVAVFLFPMGQEPVAPSSTSFSPYPVVPLVEAVQFTGNRTVSETTLRKIVGTRAGHLYDPRSVFEDLGILAETHLFAEVKGRLFAGEQGLIVRFELLETDSNSDQ